jgi:hypothetical protein
MEPVGCGVKRLKSALEAPSANLQAPEKLQTSTVTIQRMAGLLLGWGK